MAAENRTVIGKRAGYVGIAVNIVLFGLKLFVGLASGSVAVMADAVNNLTDAGSSILVTIGYIISGKPADREHPYGYARMEYLCGLFISLIVTVLGVELFRSSLDSLIHAEEAADFTVSSVVIMVSAILAKGGLAVFYYLTGRSINSDTLKASAVDSIGDVCSTGAVILGILLTPVLGAKADGIFGCIVAAYIFVMGVKLVFESSGTILGTPPEREFVQKMVQKIKSYDGVLGIHDLVVHSYGAEKTFVTVHVETDASRDVMECHDVIDNIEADFRKESGIQMTIHMDPVRIDDPETNRLHASVREIIDHIAAENNAPLSMHDFRVVFGVSHTNLIFDIAISNEFPMRNDELVERIRSDVLKTVGDRYRSVITVDRDYNTERF